VTLIRLGTVEVIESRLRNDGKEDIRSFGLFQQDAQVQNKGKREINVFVMVYLVMCVTCSRLTADTEEMQPTVVISETTGRSYLKGDARLKKRSTSILFGPFNVFSGICTKICCLFLCSYLIVGCISEGFYRLEIISIDQSMQSLQDRCN